MCGITGILAREPGDGRWAAPLGAMCDALAHRGPDDQGQWVDVPSGVALGHRRLSVIDLSETGHQPMASPSGRYRVVFNGEIYDYRELREELEGRGFTWRGTSDTEVMLAGFEAWGVEGTLEKLVGMFALAVWDARERVLWLVRDRLGEKPLYWGWFGGGSGDGVLLFGSELKALRRHPAFDGELDRGAVASLLRLNYVPSPRTVYRRVRKLEPGSFVRIELARWGEASVRRYWDVDAVAAEVRETGCGPGGVAATLDSWQEALERVEALLARSLDEKMLADVPVGAFLSGGVDSTLAVAMLQRRLSSPVRTFTIGFETQKHDEATFARETAAYLGTRHTELVVTAREMLDVVPRLPSMYDEPFADASQIPTFLVSRLAREQVTVGISGDGGDELFGGYDRYRSAPRRFARLGRLPSWMLRIGTARQRRRAQRSGRRRKALERVAALEASHDFRRYYLAVMSDWFRPEDVVLGAADGETALARGDEPERAFLRGEEPAPGERLAWMMRTDMLTYLPDGVLCKVDRASMAVSLEVRTPFLDHRVVELALAMPDELKLRDGQEKWITRTLLDRYVPRELMDRPKKGFNVPLSDWLRGELRDWAEAQLDERRLREEGIFEPQAIRRRWEEHREGVQDWNYALWSVLMFQAWSEAQRAEALVSGGDGAGASPANPARISSTPSS